MSTARVALIVLIAAVLAAVLPAAAGAQTGEGGPDPESAPVRIGPFFMNPRLELGNLGVDDNVFNDAQNPKRDFTLTLTPTTDIWLRIGRSWLKTNIREDIVWFQQYSSERSTNTSYTIDWRLPLNYLVVDLSPSYVNTRERPGFEIDARAARTEYGGRGTVELKTFSRTFIGVAGTYRKVDFDGTAAFFGTNLRNELNRTEKSGAVTMRLMLTPLTTVTFAVGQEQDRFEFSPLRDSNSTDARATFAFDPHALLKGSASFGYRDFHPLAGGLADYRGAVAAGSLTYTLLGTTRFQADFKRDVSYSYDVNEPYYLETGITGSVAQQIFGPVDVIGRAGTSSLAYRDRAGAELVAIDRVDHVRTYGGGVGYHFGPNIRLGFNVDKQHRASELAAHDYDGLRYGTSVTYAF